MTRVAYIESKVLIAQCDKIPVLKRRVCVSSKNLNE